jgi:hypothetical protein
MQALRILVVVMGVMIVAGVVTLGMLLAQRLSAPVTARVENIVLDEPAGTEMVSVVPVGDALAVQLHGGGRPDRVVLVGVASGRVVGRIGLAP